MAEPILTRQTIQEAPRVLVIRMAGALDGSHGQNVDEYVTKSLQCEQPRHVLLDLGGVSYVNSMLLGSLVFWKKEVARRGGVLVLFALQPLVAAVIRTVGFHRLLTLATDQAAALGALPA